MEFDRLNSMSKLVFYSTKLPTSLKLPLVEEGISAGFPSPADDFLDLAIDLNEELIHNRASTFFARVRGESMQDAGLDHGDLLIIDKSLEPTDGKIAVCYIDGEFTVKRIKTRGDYLLLVAENKKYAPIKVTQNNDFVVWGIVTNVIKFV